VIPDDVRHAVMERAGYRCEYCLIVGWELQVDHIMPRSPRRGDQARLVAELDDRQNLAAACSRCNRLKGNFVTGPSVLFGATHPLFNPRTDEWSMHFAWSADYRRIVPLTPTGDATIERLDMNAPVLRRQRELLRRAARAGGTPWP